jgi:hypothetical protein
MPIVCVTDAAGLGVRGTVIPWPCRVTEISPRKSNGINLRAVSFDMLVKFTVNKCFGILKYDLHRTCIKYNTQTAKVADETGKKLYDTASAPVKHRYP